MKKFYKIFLLSLLLIPLPFLFSKKAFSSDADFVIDTDTQVSYGTGDDFVTVKTEYIRKVENKTYFFPATGEKIFHIPDISGAQEEEIEVERKHKIETLTVRDIKGHTINYSIEQKEIGKGLYVTVPNYKTTTPSSPYHVVMEYQTHDYVLKIGNFVNIVGTSLPEETIFERRDQENGTLTVFNYYFTIVVDNDIGPLAKAFPTYSKSEIDGGAEYVFEQSDRIGNAPYLEFGTSVLYRFELKYTTQQTDSLIPEKYSEIFQALSTNVYELSLPREFSETKQKVYFTEVNPLPEDMYRDTEGNILAVFEVPANQESTIEVSGYILVEQDELAERTDYSGIDYDEYLESIKNTEYISKYLGPTKYWQVNDKYIKEEADKLKEGKETLFDVIQANYQYINEELDYDLEKATSENERIGAKEALFGGPSVCMEYADVMISLLRAQGIPSRAAIGYANLREIAPTDQIRHQWVQIWVPEYGWLSVDPTFESSNMKIGQMVDRVLWEVFNNDSLSNIRIYSANNIVDLTTEGFTMNIYGTDEDVDLENLKTYTDLISTNGIRDVSSTNIVSLFSTVLKTTTLGKALLITIPILLVLVVLIVLIATISFLIKKGKRKKLQRMRIETK